MPPGKDRNPSGLGRAIINRKFQDDRQRATTASYTTDLEANSKLKSVTQESDLDGFLNAAQLADTEFTAEKQNVTIIRTPSSVPSAHHNPLLLSSSEQRNVSAQHALQKDRLRVPRRPKWSKDMSHAELERNEKDAFLDWRRNLAGLQDNTDLVLTPFERNLEVWRQLWRVLERSDLVVQILDARNPLRFRCEDLEAYVKEMNDSMDSASQRPAKQLLLLVNKADLLTSRQRSQWADYFSSQKLNFAFYSAAHATLHETDNSSPVEDASISHSSEDESGSESETQAEDSSIHICSAEELVNLFLGSDQEAALNETELPSPKVVGLVGYPNVGKSSTINSLIGAKKVSVSSTPGKTKHFQTIPLTPTLTLCDCPGLVFPQFAATPADLVCDGVLPIDQLREYTAPVDLVLQRIPAELLELTYGLTLRKLSVDLPHEDILTSSDLLMPYAVGRGFTRSGQGNPDEARAARYILKDFVNAKLLFCHAPPGTADDEFNTEAQQATIQHLKFRKRKMVPSSRVTETSDVFIDLGPGQTGPINRFDSQYFASPDKGIQARLAGGKKQGTKAFWRPQNLPHQNMVNEDGTPILHPPSAVARGSSKKHNKRNQKRDR